MVSGLWTVLLNRASQEMLYTDRGRVRHWEEQVRKYEDDDGPGCGVAFVKTMQEL